MNERESLVGKMCRFWDGHRPLGDNLYGEYGVCQGLTVDGHYESVSGHYYDYAEAVAVTGLDIRVEPSHAEILTTWWRAEYPDYTTYTRPTAWRQRAQREYLLEDGWHERSWFATAESDDVEE